MTPEYKVRREAKHAAQLAERGITIAGPVFQTIDLVPQMAGHAFVGLKSRPQASSGGKNRSGYAQEHRQATLDNIAYDMVHSEKSIGGVSENLGLPGSDEGPVSV